MAQANGEIWMHLGLRTWKVYNDVTDDFRMELYRNGWTQVHQNETEEHAVERKPVVKPQNKKK